MRYFALISMVLLLCCWGGQGFAQDACGDLDENPDWTRNMDEFKSFAASGKYDKALDTSEKLFAICYDSPILYTLTGEVVAKKGEKRRAMKYFRRAAELEAKYPTAGGEAKKIWFSYYEAETKRHNDFQLAKTVLWTGTGLGLVGVAAVVAGGILVGTQDKYVASDKNSKMAPLPRGPLEDHGKDVLDCILEPSQKASDKLNPEYIAGWAVLGVGLGMTIVGAVMAGIGGYRYSHSPQVMAENDISVLFGGNYAGIQVSF